MARRGPSGSPDTTQTVQANRKINFETKGAKLLLTRDKTTEQRQICVVLPKNEGLK